MLIGFGLLVATFDLWISFVFAMWSAKGKTRYEFLSPSAKVFVGYFIVKDVFYNYTWASLMFWEFASNDRKLLTARLKHILFSGEYDTESWRWELAYWMCQYLIEPWDKGHCNLSKIDVI